MNRQPVNPDDLQLTAYALGELSSSERIEFENRLEVSPEAQAELESMDEMMSLLSGALKEEWCSEMKEPSLEVLAPTTGETNIVPFSSRKTKRAYAAVAAAVAAMLVAGAALLPKTSVETESSFASAPTEEPTLASIRQSIQFPGITSGISVPHLYLTEEVQNPGNLDLAEALANLDELGSPVDASYLDSVNTPAENSSAPVSVAERRVDSYLPGEQGGVFDRESGLIEQRRKQSELTNVGDSRVFVRGYVAMDGAAPPQEAAASSPGVVLAGFRPVSMIGNPVEELEVDLRLISDFQSIQRELARIAKKMEDSEAKDELNSILERNRKAVNELKREFAR